MYRRIAILLFVIGTCAATGVGLRAEIIDRIAAVVDGRIITLSDIRKERAIQAVVGESSAESQQSAQSDEAVLKSMMDRYLLEEEMAQYPGLDVTDEEIDERMKTITDFHGVPMMDIRNAITAEIRRYKYSVLRYRPYIVVSNEEIETYYKSNFVPEAQKRGAVVPDLSQVREMISSNIFEEKLLHEVEASLESLRERSNDIEIFQ